DAHRGDVGADLGLGDGETTGDDGLVREVRQPVRHEDASAHTLAAAANARATAAGGRASAASRRAATGTRAADASHLTTRRAVRSGTACSRLPAGAIRWPALTTTEGQRRRCTQREERQRQPEALVNAGEFVHHHHASLAARYQKVQREGGGP